MYANCYLHETVTEKSVPYYHNDVIGISCDKDDWCSKRSLCAVNLSRVCSMSAVSRSCILIVLQTIFAVTQISLSQSITISTQLTVNICPLTIEINFFYLIQWKFNSLQSVEHNYLHIFLNISREWPRYNVGSVSQDFLGSIPTMGKYKMPFRRWISRHNEIANQIWYPFLLIHLCLALQSIC